jgi:uroporphyrinogen decarboxylase
MSAARDAAFDPAKPLLLRALAGEPVDHPPVWLFRQAGRYLPEYRKLRERVSFGELCSNPEAACEATLQPIRRFALDASIVFSDLLVPLEGLGYTIHYGDHGPEVADPPQSAREAALQTRFEANATVTAPARTLTLLARELPKHVARIGFCGAPLTLALYLLEGKGSKGFEKARARAFADEGAFVELLDGLAGALVEYAKLQVAGGAQVIQVFDSWGGLVAPADWRRLVLPAATRLVAGVREAGVPVVWFLRGSPDHARLALESGPDGISVDWTVELDAFAGGLAKARAQAKQPEITVQGNLDPALLVGPPAVAVAHALTLRERLFPRFRWIFNLGHGITPDARVECVEAVVDAIVRGTSDLLAAPRASEGSR